MKQEYSEGVGAPFTTAYAQGDNESGGNRVHLHDYHSERSTESHGIARRDRNLSGKRQRERDTGVVR